MTSFAAARDLLLTHRTDYDSATRLFQWPDLSGFNWAIDWFDGALAGDPASAGQDALIVLDAATGEETRLSFGAMSRRSNQVANYLTAHGIGRGDCILILLGNVPALWEVMLAAMKLGAVVVPATPLLTSEELRDRLERGAVKLVVSAHDQTAKFDALGNLVHARVAVGGSRAGWDDYDKASACPDRFAPDARTEPDDPFLLYFTSGTTARPKLVLHSQASYPVGSLSTMYWIGLQPGDVHLNISSPGWAKHAWSSLFAPWNAGATILVLDQPRFSARVLLDTLTAQGVTTLCAPPTVWRMIVQENLSTRPPRLRELCSAGEPLNPEVIERIERAWGLTIRDGYGQTETTAQVGNSPGQLLKPGAMGRVLPGYRLTIRDADGCVAEEGEVCVEIEGGRPLGLMQGYLGESGGLEGVDGSFYRTGDVAFRDGDGYFTFVGRADDVFKSSDYRISPFELESVLIEHPLIVEAAVVPAPDPQRLAIPKAYVLLVEGAEAGRETARAIFTHLNSRLAPFKRVRRIEFVSELPKTISGKIRRVQLRRQEHEAALGGSRRDAEYREDDA